MNKQGASRASRFGRLSGGCLMLLSPQTFCRVQQGPGWRVGSGVGSPLDVRRIMSYYQSITSSLQRTRREPWDCPSEPRSKRGVNRLPQVSCRVADQLGSSRAHLLSRIRVLKLLTAGCRRMTVAAAVAGWVSGGQPNRFGSPSHRRVAIFATA
jgi:hypothetical protein